MDYSGAGNNPTVVLLRGLGLSFLVTFFGQRLLPIIPNIISGAVYRRTLGWFEAGVTNSWKMGVISPGVATQTMPNPRIWQSADRAVGWVIAGTLDDANRCSPGCLSYKHKWLGCCLAYWVGLLLYRAFHPAAGAVLHWQDSLELCPFRRLCHRVQLFAQSGQRLHFCPSAATRAFCGNVSLIKRS